jgi:hypothetical protein
MKILTININAKDTDDFKIALEEIDESISKGFTSGFDWNEDSGYAYRIDENDSTTTRAYLDEKPKRNTQPETVQKHFSEIDIGDLFIFQDDIWCRTSKFAAKCLSGDYGSCAFGRHEHPETHLVEAILDQKALYQNMLTSTKGIL